MSAFEELLNRKWILRSENPELYLKVKDSIKEVRKIFQEKFGYMLILTPYLIKLEKIPGFVEEWMGIQEFQSIEEYQMYCYILMFLEDKEREEQFVLSSLTEFIQMQFGNQEIDWTKHLTRRRLVRVLQYCMSIHIIECTDGNEDQFAKDENTEVLYENTGYSRYILRSFSRDIMEYDSQESIEKGEWYAMEEDRGIVRRQRVYRRLLLSCGVYRKDENDEDFVYIRHYRNQIEKDFQSYCSCELQVYKSSAYINLFEDCSLKHIFPSNNALSDLILVFMYQITKKIKNKQCSISLQEVAQIDDQQCKRWMKRWFKECLPFLPKKYQELDLDVLCDEVKASMLRNGFIAQEENQIQIFPICGKIGGFYDLEVK